MEKRKPLHSKMSIDQLDLMLEYMEKHGDLSVCTSPADNLEKWANLTNLLNCKGYVRSGVYWRKVWSDLKMNARMNFKKMQTNSNAVVLNVYDERLLTLLGEQLQTTGDNGTKVVDEFQNEESNDDELSLSNYCYYEEETRMTDEQGSKEPNKDATEDPVELYISRESRVSHEQMNIMLDYMERNGDLSPLGFFRSQHKWDELVTLLNANGDCKSCEKWRKTWSDFKHKTKNKIAKMWRGGSPNLLISLTHNEKRALKFLKVPPKFAELLKDSIESESQNSHLVEAETEHPPVEVSINEADEQECQESQSSTNSSPLKKRFKDSCGVVKDLNSLDTQIQIMTYKQLHLMVNYMEIFGDLSKSQSGQESKVEYSPRWNDLSDSLNQKGKPRSTAQWQKTWNDLKRIVLRKKDNITEGHHTNSLAGIERRVLAILVEDDAEHNHITIRHVETENNSEDEGNKTSPLYSAVEATSQEAVPEPRVGIKIEPIERDSVESKSRPSSVSSSASSQCSHKAKKRKTDNDDKVIRIAEKFLDYERQRDEREHEREMTRMRQSERILTVLDRVVNVMECLTPGIRKCLDEQS